MILSNVFRKYYESKVGCSKMDITCSQIAYSHCMCMHTAGSTLMFDCGEQYMSSALKSSMMEASSAIRLAIRLWRPVIASISHSIVLMMMIEPKFRKFWLGACM